MNYKQTLDYLYSQLPMFQRTGSAAYKANLDNTIAICKLLDNPENKILSVHVAGTNGKGSTSHTIASILQEAGLKVGLYTSPHLKDFRERIKINGEMIPKKTITAFVKKYREDFDTIQPSFFEMTVGLAFDYFSKQKVDIAIIETGLGGRLDSTNVINPLVSVITNISIDHANLLGNTLEKIAGEKAGIIKHKTPVIIGESQTETNDVFLEKAKKLESNIFFADQEYKIENQKLHALNQEFVVSKQGKVIFKKLNCPLKGLYQSKNVLTVLKTAEILSFFVKISHEHIEQGIAKVIENTGLKGRWQTLNNNPLTICDTGHNEAGISEVINQISITPHKDLHFILGMVNDKEIEKILLMLPKNATYYFCKADIPRALDANILQQKALEIGLRGSTYPSVKKALKAAQKKAETNDLVFVGGSTFVVAEVV